MADPRVVILNDTDVNGYHFGCAKVMGTIRAQIAERDVSIAGTVKTSVNWRDAHSDMVETADLLIINGEGTLHHGSKRGRWLLEAAATVKAKGGKVALINALWQDNPTDWTDLVQNIDILSCRDSRSAHALTEATAREDIRFIGDLSMCSPVTPRADTRSGIIFGDSVHADITYQLATLSRDIPSAQIVPVTSSLKFISPHLKGMRRQARSAYAALKQRRYLARNPNAQFLPTKDDYIQLVSHAELSVTGRFHAVCLAIATRTPFIAVDSNSWKIAALINDLGLSTTRRMDRNNLTVQAIGADDWSYSPEELANIDARLDMWQHAANTLFSDIVELAQPNHG